MRLQACQQSFVTVQNPPSDFQLSDALSSLDVSQMSGSGDVSMMTAGAQTLASLAGFAHSAEAGQTSEQQQQVQAAINTKASSMITSLSGSASTLIDDPQSMDQVSDCVDYAVWASCWLDLCVC